MVLHISQCHTCPKDRATCEYYQTLRATLKSVSPKTAHVSHRCSEYFQIFQIGDVVSVSTEVAYEKVEESNGYSNYEAIEKIVLQGRGTVIDKANNGKLLVKMDCLEDVEDIVKSQIEHECGVYGKIGKDGDDLEQMKQLGYPFWVTPNCLTKQLS